MMRMRCGGHGRNRGKVLAVDEEPSFVPPESDSSDDDAHVFGPGAFDACPSHAGQSDAGPSHPKDSGILPLQPTHRTRSFNQPGPINKVPLRVRQHHIQLQWHDEYNDIFQEASLYRCLQIGLIHIDMYLITALAER